MELNIIQFAFNSNPLTFILFLLLANRNNNGSLSVDPNETEVNHTTLDVFSLDTSKPNIVTTTEKIIPEYSYNQNEVQPEKDVENEIVLGAYNTTSHPELQNEPQSHSKSKAANQMPSKDIFIVCFLCFPIVLWAMVHICHKIN